MYDAPLFTTNTAVHSQPSPPGAWLKSEETVAMKTKRADFAAAYLRGRMVVAGGLGHEPSALDTVEAFHPQRKKWERLAPMNFPRCSTSSIVIRDRLLVVGGVNQVARLNRKRRSIAVPSSAHEILYVKEEEYL
ncbi:Kelch domain-containing protein 8A [Liparis tanakae]|uniref:Kelch domain-containing protein 8A n=1 Tax=Liparis tanakae TaxID=230148 RepID=A0A4Z2FUT8_9TELE|nr:Kelch domain-containing protein 8A [Liparis tanakae]